MINFIAAMILASSIQTIPLEKYAVSNDKVCGYYEVKTQNMIGIITITRPTEVDDVFIVMMSLNKRDNGAILEQNQGFGYRHGDTISFVIAPSLQTETVPTKSVVLQIMEVQEVNGTVVLAGRFMSAGSGPMTEVWEKIK